MFKHKRILIAGIFLVFASFLIQGIALAETVDEKEARLRAELAATEKEILIWQAELRTKQGQSASFARDVAILNAKIKEAQATIKAGQLKIEQLSKEIDLKRGNIEALDAKIGRGKESLAQLIRRTNETESFSLVETVLSQEELSEFLVDLDTFDSVNRSLHSSFVEIREAKAQLEIEKQELGVKINKETDIKVATEAERRRVEANEAEQKRLLALSRSEERSYEQVIIDREKKAAGIRAALFSLRDTAAIPFGTALEYARLVESKTGVRAAFLLGILTQESNLGQNIGQCFVKNTTNGDGVGKNTGRFFSGVMHPTRDVPVFLALAGRLGFDATTQPVSCPQPGGYGGAMGPSQFIPSTWVMYESRLASLVGGGVPNPWEPRHAFFASGLFLADLGAGGGGYSAEREAAARYYAGGGWATRGLGYADSVLGHARRIQETMIDPLNF